MRQQLPSPRQGYFWEVRGGVLFEVNEVTLFARAVGMREATNAVAVVKTTRVCVASE